MMTPEEIAEAREELDQLKTQLEDWIVDVKKMNYAAGPWETGKPPENEGWIMGVWGKDVRIVKFQGIDGRWCSMEGYWCINAPQRWARINLPEGEGNE